MPWLTRGTQTRWLARAQEHPAHGPLRLSRGEERGPDYTYRQTKGEGGSSQGLAVAIEFFRQFDLLRGELLAPHRRLIHDDSNYLWCR
jgi:hypothetical protein